MNDTTDSKEHKAELNNLRPVELHYFRIPRERWELMLIRLRQMGATAVSTVVPWNWHEPRDGAFDVTGITHPARNILGFLSICAAIELPVILRLTPFVGEGLLGGGVPMWLLETHPEIQALGPDLTPRRHPVDDVPYPSVEHPTYLKYVQRWYEELAQSVTDKVGIVALRLDDIGPTDWDYHPHVVEVQWPVWLRQQYDDLAALNAAWGTSHRSFSDAEFPRQPPTEESSPRFLDATRFATYAATRATQTYVDLLREAGWTVPILTAAKEIPTVEGLDLGHTVQVDSELPFVGGGVHWATEAPIGSDGYPRRSFWAIKARLLEMEQGVKQVEGATLVTHSDSQRIRLPRPKDGHGVYRLLLDGGLLETSARIRGDALYLDYLAADEVGETDMFILLNDSSAPLSGYLRYYLTSMLLMKARALHRAGARCEMLEEIFEQAALSPEDVSFPALEDLRAAEVSLAEARRAVSRATASLGKLEDLVGSIQGHDAAVTSLDLVSLSLFSPSQIERLIPIRQACAQAAPNLIEAAQIIEAQCRGDDSSAEGFTVQVYQKMWRQVQNAAREAEECLLPGLRSLRTDLAAGTMPSAAWPIHNWLVQTLRGLLAVLQ